MLIPKEKFDARQLDEFDVVIERRQTEGGHSIIMFIQPQEEVDDGEVIGIPGESVFHSLVHGLYYEYAQEQDIGGVDSLQDYIAEIIKLLEEIDERGTATIPERKKGLVH